MTKKNGSFVSDNVDGVDDDNDCEGQDSSVNIVTRLDGRDQFLHHKKIFVATSPLMTLKNDCCLL
jgi:hypothetical protein